MKLLANNVTVTPAFGAFFVEARCISKGGDATLQSRNDYRSIADAWVAVLKIYAAGNMIDEAEFVCLTSRELSEEQAEVFHGPLTDAQHERQCRIADMADEQGGGYVNRAREIHGERYIERESE